MNPSAPTLPERLRRAAEAAAETYGTPVYLLDWNAVAAEAAAISAAFEDAQGFYAMKANPLLTLLARLAGQGWGFEAVSAGELERAQRAAPGAPVVLNGPGKTPAELDLAAGLGAVISLDALDEIGRVPRGASVLLRVNPGLEPHTHPHLATGAANAKFGLLPADLDAALAATSRAGLKLLGLHVHIGSLISAPGDYAQAFDVVSGLAVRSGPLPVLDIGGGFGPDLDLPRVAALAAQAAAAFQARVWLEPGRRLVARAGLLVARVRSVKRTGRPFVILDAGMTELIRPMLYGAEHPIVSLARAPEGARPAAWVVAGPACESGDILGQSVPLADPRPGDLLAVLVAGAYGSSMASGYLTRGRPPEVILDGEGLSLARRREEPADLIALETFRPIADI